MKSVSGVLPFIAMAFISWGLYGPILHQGQYDMGNSSLRPFIGVGAAYFLIAVLFPILRLKIQAERGNWTTSGFLWSFAGGAAGAIGALGITLAFKFRGDPVYVMPLVFGLAPVVNTFVTMWSAKTYKKAGSLFFVGLVLVALGAAGVLLFKPSSKSITIQESGADNPIIIVEKKAVDGAIQENTWRAENLRDLETNPELAHAYNFYLRKKPHSPIEFIMIMLSIALTAICWGSYGHVLHKGQDRMAGSRLRPFICVGLAYFVFAVILPVLYLSYWTEPGYWSFSGSLWSLGAGAAGAFGALGIILAFNSGGKPVFVMPLVFGCAPVINTISTSIWEGTTNQIGLAFILALALVITGAVMVLTFVPKVTPAAAAPSKAEPAE